MIGWRSGLGVGCFGLGRIKRWQLGCVLPPVPPVDADCADCADCTVYSAILARGRPLGHSVC
jgi:hypothetical protein